MLYGDLAATAPSEGRKLLHATARIVSFRAGATFIAGIVIPTIVDRT